MVITNRENLPPSPIMAMTAPQDWNAETIRILCLGVVWAKTVIPPTCWHNIWSLSSLLSLTSIDPCSWGKGILKFNSSLIDSQDWVSKGRRWWPRGIFFPTPSAAHCSASIRRHAIIIDDPVLDGWVLIDSCLTWPINADSLCPHRTIMMGKPRRGSA